MKIAIFLFDGVTALDAVGPFESLARLTDNEIVFVARRAGMVRSGDGFLGLSANAGIAGLTSADILIVPGGHRTGLRAVMADKDVQAWIRLIDGEARWTCSVCSGALLLGAAGLLAGRRASTHWRARDYLARFGATYCPARVTVDGKYMTSAGVSSGIDLGLRLCSEIASRDLAEAIELSMQYAPEPPFGTGDPANATPERIALVENTLRN